MDSTLCQQGSKQAKAQTQKHACSIFSATCIIEVQLLRKVSEEQTSQVGNKPKIGCPHTFMTPVYQWTPGKSQCMQYPWMVQRRNDKSLWTLCQLGSKQAKAHTCRSIMYHRSTTPAKVSEEQTSQVGNKPRQTRTAENKHSTITET
jgi:hypothetical protein